MTLSALVASRKSRGDVVGGALKATLGFIILGIGAGAVIGALLPLGALITGSFGVAGVVPTNEAITAIVNDIPDVAQNIAFAMFIGVIGSLVIARLTPLRYVFLTGHHMLFMATVLTVVLYNANVEPIVQILVAAFGLATMMVIMPAFTMPWMKKVTGNQPIAMGHFGSLGYIAAGLTGQVVGRGSKSTEEMEFPQGLRFLRDPMVGTAVAMIFIYIGLATVVRPAGRSAMPRLRRSPTPASSARRAPRVASSASSPRCSTRRSSSVAVLPSSCSASGPSSVRSCRRSRASPSA